MNRRADTVRRWAWMGTLGMLLAAPAEAHVRSESFSRWLYADGQLTMTFTVSAREATRLPAALAGREPSDAVADHLRGNVDPGPTCTASAPPRPIAARPGYLRAEAEWRCTREPEALRIGVFLALAAEHAHFLTWEHGDRVDQHLILSNAPVWHLPRGASGDPAQAPPVSASAFSAYMHLGMTHILGGPDHIVFLFALLLACSRAWQTVWAVTGFTIGHSLTLALTVLGVTSPSVTPVEAAIGLTIALPALERGLRGTPDERLARTAAFALMLILLPFALAGGGKLGLATLAGLALFSVAFLAMDSSVRRGAAYWAAVSALFGLIHGFGFAGGFAASGSGIAVSPAMLLAFNLGVELGQLLILGVLLALMTAAGRLGSARGKTIAADMASAAVFGMGLYWFYGRGL